jgi:prodigiosin/undecylprodigiosin synthetase
MSFVVSLKEADAKDVLALGGKGASLAAMIQAGIPVPKGCCIKSSAYKEFLTSSNLADRINKSTSLSKQDCEELQALTLSTEMPTNVARDIIEAYNNLDLSSVAVRSSGIQEDSVAHSFAGQHDTFLNIKNPDQVIMAVKKCWASLWSARALTYRNQNYELEHADSIAVVVQEMVIPEASGVLFTTDPVGSNPNHMVLETCWGLGEGIVAGQVTTDCYIIDKQDLSVFSRQIRYKIMMSLAVSDGRVELVKVPYEKRDVAVLTDKQVIELANLALRLRDLYGVDLDIEWAYRNGYFYILQARPITTSNNLKTDIVVTIANYDEKIRPSIMWTRMDVGEIYNGMLTPLGVSFSQYYQHNVHGDCFRALGIKNVGESDKYMEHFQGYVFVNASYWAHLLSQCPPTRDLHSFTDRFLSEEVDASNHVNPFGQWPSGFDFIKSSYFWLEGFIKELATMKRRASQMVETRFREYDRFQQFDLKSMSLSELNAELQRGQEYFRKMCEGYVPYYINAFAFYDVLSTLCKQWFGESSNGIQNRLKTQMSNLRTVEVTRDVWALANKASMYDGITNILKLGVVSEMPSLLRDHPEGVQFWNKEVVPFMRNHGTRSWQEMELTNPRWIDDPSYIFQMVRKFLNSDSTLEDIIQDRGLKHSSNYNSEEDQEIQTLVSKLPIFKRHILNIVIKLYSKCSELRETTRMSFINQIWIVRRIVYEVARRLIDQGILHNFDEVAYMDYADIQNYLSEKKEAKDCFSRKKIEANYRLHQFHMRLPDPPLTFIGAYDPTERFIRDVNTEIIEGLGASPGKARGKARVIHDLVRQADEFQPGEILVAHFTDASWTPLFVTAAGVIADIGSMLSHSSIVAREFKIPAIVNTRIATKAIRTGDTVIVDGTTGTVHIQRDKSVTEAGGAMASSMHA